MTKKPSKSPLYQQIGHHLAESICSGKYPVGSTLPTEMELCRLFKVGRHTAREALRVLVEMGLVERRKRTGTTVIRRHPRPQFGFEADATDQLQRYLKSTDVHVYTGPIELDVLPDGVELDGEPEEWVKVETYRCVPGSKRGVSWTDIYLRKQYQHIAQFIPVQSGEYGGVYPLLEEHCGEVVQTIELEISAAQFPPAVARFLGYSDNDPALVTIRTFRNPEDMIMEVAVSFYPPYEFRYVTRLSRSNGIHRALR